MKAKNRILVDCRFITNEQFGGIEVYAREIIKYLYVNGYEPLVLISNPSAEKFLSNIKDLKTHLWPFRLNFVEKLTNPTYYKEIGCDIFYSPVWFPGYLGIKTFKRVVVTLHDCIPQYVYPNLKHKIRHYGVVSLGILLSDLVITDSNFSKMEIKRLFPFSLRKIRNYPVPLPIEKLSAYDNSILSKNNLKKEGYFLFVSALKPYKGFDRAIKALIKNKNLKPSLVVVGTPKTCYGELDIDTLKSREVLFTGHVSDAQLNSLYKNALALVFPSRYEGFGLPIIEAQYHGCPVIATHTASIPEVGGDSVLYVMPDKEEALIQSLSEKMDRIATDKRLRESLIQRGYENIQRFMPEKVLPGIVDAILGR